MIPVTYSQANQGIVDGYENRTAVDKDPAYWNDDAVTPVRSQIKNHYISDQQQRCCYCRLVYPTNHNAVWDGEHIIPRALAARFMFEPRNLAASCKDCNNAKSDQEVRVRPNRVSFPDQSAHYKIMHPHFDEYDQHIAWYGKVVRALSQKGIKLVEMCNLQRFGLAKIGADTLPINATVAETIGKFMDPNLPPLEAEMALASLQAYVKTIKPKN
ncbi:hypothetical protein [Mesorhizobium sp.]|uniref:hypothetical protein n=1 Tax=Mesorhizobium sp. TaxID=1871066 RepID=UPI00121AF533|nr:hypothetical protein [Mesorhizobium sp.]TJV19667.1 MAG: hypothetical protein E5Y07_00290 [Mesorhizobium sp.]